MHQVNRVIWFRYSFNCVDQYISEGHKRVCCLHNLHATLSHVSPQLPMVLSVRGYTRKVLFHKVIFVTLCYLFDSVEAEDSDSRLVCVSVGYVRNKGIIIQCFGFWFPEGISTQWVKFSVEFILIL